MAAKDFYQVSLKVILTDDEGKILGLKGLPDGMLQGKYDVPGGRIDDHELEVPYTTILAREMQEELGDFRYVLNPVPVAISRVEYPGRPGVQGHDLRVLYIFFAARYVSGELRFSEEHEGLRWFDGAQTNFGDVFAKPIADGIKQYLRIT